MKKLVFKGWVVNVLLGLSLIALMIMASDSDDTKTFIIVHLVAIIIFTICALLLKKFGGKRIIGE